MVAEVAVVVLALAAAAAASAVAGKDDTCFWARHYQRSLALLLDDFLLL